MLKTFREILTPVQFAQLFLFVERSVHKKELSLLDDDKDENSQQRAEKKEKDAIKGFFEVFSETLIVNTMFLVLGYILHLVIR